MKKLSVFGYGVMAGLSMFASPVSAHDDGKPQPQLVGAWQVVVTLRVDAPDCTTAAVVGTGLNPFLSLHTFHRGGTMSESERARLRCNRTSGHGVWDRTGNRSFQYRAVFLQLR